MIMARGYAQTYEFDYQEIFAPVTKMNIIQVILSIIVNLN